MMNERLEHAKMQRFEALKNAIATIKVFAMPSLDPDTYEGFCEAEKQLLKMYKPKKTWQEHLRSLKKR